MTNCINCPNCGAPADLTADRCPYCETPYPRPRKAGEAVAVPQISMDPHTLAVMARQLEAGIITPNEARRRMGLREL